MSRIMELTTALHALMDEGDAGPSDDPAVAAARKDRAEALLTELAGELNAETRRVEAETAQIRAETDAMKRRARLLKMKTAEINALTARAERGQLSREEAMAALVHYAFLKNADALDDEGS